MTCNPICGQQPALFWRVEIANPFRYLRTHFSNAASAAPRIGNSPERIDYRVPVGKI
jgi:hypothetical protein